MTTKKKNRVLAIDDEPAMIEWLKILLEHEGYEVRTAMIGTRGEEIFKTWKPDVVVTDMMLPGRGRPGAAAQVQADPRRHRSDRHHRPWQRPEGGRGDEGRRAQFRREADRARYAAGHARARHRAPRPRRREPAAQAEARGAVPLRQHHRQEQEDARGARAGRERRRQRRQHPHPGRERHRQGAHRQRHSLQQQAREGAVHQDQLRGDPEGPDRIGAVRLQEGGVHRRAERQGRALRDGGGGLAAARRDRRDAVRTCRPSCCASCRSANTGRLAAIGSSASTSG